MGSSPRFGPERQNYSTIIILQYYCNCRVAQLSGLMQCHLQHLSLLWKVHMSADKILIDQ